MIPRRALWSFAAVAMSLVALGVAASQVDFGAIRAVYRDVEIGQVVLAVGALFAGVLIASVRLQFIAADVGTRISLRDAIAAFGIGQLAGILFVQFFGQLFARSAFLSARGVSMPANIAISIYERAVAFAVSAGLALIGAWGLFGHIVLDLSGGGAALVFLLVGLVCAFAGAAALAWGSYAKSIVVAIFDRRAQIAILRSGLLTVVIQATTACAYLVVARAVAPSIETSKILEALFIVMFAASLPISFAGWGIRELSAVFALGAIGLSAASALVISITVGLISLGLIGLISAVAVITPSRGSALEQKSPHGARADATAFLMMALPLAAATAVFFQIHIPTADGHLNVNLADPIVMLGAITFLWLIYSTGRTKVWRISCLPLHVVSLSVAVALSFAIGYFRFGMTTWAFTNKMLGWFVLLCYGATGALIVRRFGQSGNRLLSTAIIGSATGIVLLGVTVVALQVNGLRIPHLGFALPLEGFQQNRNSFAFSVLIAASCIPVLAPHMKDIAFVVCGVGLLLSGSRAGYGAALVVVLLLIWTHTLSLRRAMGLSAIACVVSAAVLLTPAIAAWTLDTFDTIIAALSPGSTGGFSSGRSAIELVPTDTLFSQEASNVERMESIRGGIALFKQFPLFGAGLGAYIDEQVKAGKLLTIHSTPLWIAAEMGLVGLAAFVAFFSRLGLYALRGTKPVTVQVLLVLAVFGVMGLVHEMMYQRIMWLVLGAGLVFALRERRKASDVTAEAAPRQQGVQPAIALS